MNDDRQRLKNTTTHRATNLKGFLDFAIDMSLQHQIESKPKLKRP